MIKVKRIPFVCGLFVGILLYLKYKTYSNNVGNIKSYFVNFNFMEPSNTTYLRWFHLQKASREILSNEDIAYNRKSIYLESKFLQNIVTLYCIVLVRNWDYVEATKATWIKGCNNYTFINIATRTKNDKIAIKRTRDNSSWTLLCSSLLKITKSYMWIIIVYENTYVIVENLRWFIASQLPSKNHYLGHSIDYWGIQYNSGDAGYVLSNSSLHKLKASLNQTCYSKNVFLNKEDFYLGKSLAELNIFPVDTRDSLGQTTFHKHAWQHELFPSRFNYKSSTYPVSCCSPKSITFKVQSNNSMYLMNYLLYKLKVFDVSSKGNRPFVTEVPDSVIWQTFLKQQGILRTNISAEEYYRIWQQYIEDPNVGNELLINHVNLHL